MTIPLEIYPGDICASAIAIDGKAEVRIDEKTPERGKELEGAILSAIEKEDVKALGYLAHVYPGIVLRYRPVHSFLNALEAKGNRKSDGDIKRIIGEPRPGRSYEDKHIIIAWVNHLRLQKGLSVREAAHRLSRERKEWSIKPESIQDIHSDYENEYDWWHQGIYVDPLNYHTHLWVRKSERE